MFDNFVEAVVRAVVKELDLLVKKNLIIFGERK